ncbi:AraC family transcriptional regulator [Vibrio cyclitrophicus]|uniref:AraC family transcriptional regulator n=1 Tax=Vibrio cyclitrophicus TaxID=47951 RepID=UPI0002F60557|nr:hypothetical protein OAM_17190 [Vibrio cyclitrophicus ZF14]
MVVDTSQSVCKSFTMDIELSSSLMAKFALDTPSSSPLSQLQMKSVFYTHATLREPWGLALPSIPSSTMFHLVLDGEADVLIGNHKIRVQKGDFILVPHGTGHDIVDVNNTPAQNLFNHPLERLTAHYERLTIEGNGAITTTLCGTVLFENGITTSIVQSMPSYILIPSLSPSHALIKHFVEAIRTETLTPDFGTEWIVPKMADLLILYCVRVWVSRMETSNRHWLLAHTDKKLAPVLRKIHAAPSEHIDIEGLARLSAMSRTRFIEYFKRQLGQTPKQYVIDWRLTQAREQLRSGIVSVLNVALAVGYQSEAAFSRAYKAKFGESPSQTKGRHKASSVESRQHDELG